jgi:hypothetical protein
MTMPNAEDEDEIDEDHAAQASLALYKWFTTLWFSLPDMTMPNAEDEDEIDEDHAAARKQAWPSINGSLLSGFLCLT